MPKLTDEQVAAQLADLENERSTVARAVTPEDAAESAKASTEQAQRIFSGRTPAFAAAGGVLLPEQTLDVVAQFVLSRPDFADWLAAQAMVGELSRKAKADKLDKLDAEIAEVRKEHNRRRVTAAKAEAEARVKDEIAALEESLKPA
jgi:hypothetical protein